MDDGVCIVKVKAASQVREERTRAYTPEAPQHVASSATTLTLPERR
jgi:hypothetical protein